MLTMHLLRMLVDLSFYFTFAGFAAAKFGGTGVLLAGLIGAVCFALSSLGGERRWLRLLLVLPAAVCFWIYPAMVDRIVLLPAMGYLAVLAVRGEYDLSWERQISLFTVFWKILIGFCMFMIVLGCFSEVTTAALPHGMAALVCSVMLMRSLRHDAGVYCQWQYQVVNLSAVGIAAALALGMSTDGFLQGCVTMMKLGYTKVFRPLLVAFITAFLLVCKAIGWLLGKLGLKRAKGSMQGISGLETGVADLEYEELEAVNTEWIKVVGVGVVVCILLAAVVLFFYWLARNRKEETPQMARDQSRESLGAKKKQAKPRETSPVRIVRAQYRKFLKLCLAHGLRLERASTSLDVDQQAQNIPGVGKNSGKIREIYLRARYAGDADKAEAEQIKQLCAQAKKDAETASE